MSSHSEKEEVTRRVLSIYNNNHNNLESNSILLFGEESFFHEEKLKKRYKKIALYVHPDKNNNNNEINYQNLFQFVQNCFEFTLEKVTRHNHTIKRTTNTRDDSVPSFPNHNGNVPPPPNVFHTNNNNNNGNNKTEEDTTNIPPPPNIFNTPYNTNDRPPMKLPTLESSSEEDVSSEEEEDTPYTSNRGFPNQTLFHRPNTNPTETNSNSINHNNNNGVLHLKELFSKYKVSYKETEITNAPLPKNPNVKKTKSSTTNNNVASSLGKRCSCGIAEKGKCFLCGD